MYKSGMTKISRGFTLVELLIVIAILAVLSTATVVVLNPAELLKQARDSQRVTDMDTLKTALGMYVASVTPIDLDAAVALCGVAGTAGATAVGPPTVASFTIAANLIDATREITGVGWLPVNFSAIPGGSPIPVLPVDPTNSVGWVYRYACDNVNSTFELNCSLESVKFATTLDLDNLDGGNNAAFYEIGTDPGLDL